jgi:hypothetical protein
MRRSFAGLLAIGSAFVPFGVQRGSTAAEPAPAKWTVMVYISGDNDLEKYVVSDIEAELAAIGSSADVQVVALADRGPGYDTSRGDWQTTKLFHVTQGMTADSSSAVADWGERNTGDPQTLIDFVQWTRTNFPADHYALYFWGHGWSWHPDNVMWDESNEDALEYHETRAAIPSLGFIDVVGYDGCNMSSLEILSLWQGNATAVTSSQEWVGGDGIEYDEVLAELAADPDMTADEVAIATSRSARHDKTWSAAAVDDRLTALVDAVDAWAEALKDHLPTYRRKYARAFRATRSFWAAPMDRDLYDMAYEIHRLVDEPTIRETSQAVMAAVDAVVLHERHAKAYRNAHGITIYYVSKESRKDEEYSYYRSTIDLALLTAWDEFLDEFADRR